MPLYDYRCPCGATTEAIRPIGTEIVTCAACGDSARRTGVSPRVGIVGPAVDARGMFRRFTEASAEMDHAARRYAHYHGEAAPVPNLWQQAKQQAIARAAAGE